MATSKTGNGTGKKIGAVGAAVVLLVGGIAGCNYLQDNTDPASDQSMARESDQPSPIGDDEANDSDPKKDQL